jgi:nicotinate-nucleotide pyrophosphorylase (carboxylating)
MAAWVVGSVIVRIFPRILRHPVGPGSQTLDQLVLRALAEDVGDADVTSEATVPLGTRAVATITQKAAGVVFGLDAAEATFLALDPDVRLERLGPEGEWRDPPAPVLRVTGDARALLAAERTALNFLQRLSGVATLTARCVYAVQGTGAQILDTRKTTPGLRTLEKAAVAAGGGVNHRAGLYDMVLIKENHAAIAGGVGAAVRAAAAAFPDVALEVECATRAEVDEALAAGATRILLDNMGPDELRAVVAHVAGRARLEASGGIGFDTLRSHAETGVDWISIGALTHSAPALDLSLLLEALP